MKTTDSKEKRIRIKSFLTMNGVTIYKSKHPDYKLWDTMISRCHNPNDQAYDSYGASGITVCKRWRRSFNNFILDMGQRPSKEMTIERISNKKGYSKSNCRWADRRAQANNRSTNIRIMYNGNLMTIAEFAFKIGMPYEATRQRIRYKKWSPERCAVTPIVKQSNNCKFFRTGTTNPVPLESIKSIQ